MAGQKDAEQQGEENAAQQRAREQRHQLLSAVMTPDAMSRLARLEMVSTGRAEEARATILKLAQDRQLHGAVDATRLAQILDSLGAETKVSVDRKTNREDEEEEDPMAALIAAGARMPGDASSDSDDGW